MPFSSSRSATRPSPSRRDHGERERLAKAARERSSQGEQVLGFDGRREGRALAQRDRRAREHRVSLAEVVRSPSESAPSHRSGEGEAVARVTRPLSGSLKPGGRIAVIDFRMDSPSGPPKSGRIEPARVKTEMTSAGFALAEEHAFLPNQYFLIFKPGT